MPTPSSASFFPAARGRTFSRQTRGIHSFLKVVRSVYRAQHRKPQYEARFVYWIQQFLRAYPNIPIRRIHQRQIRVFLKKQARTSTVSAREEKNAREALHFLWVDVLPKVRGNQ